MTQRIEGRILTPNGWVLGRICFNERIDTIEADDFVSAQHYILPGFIDLHVHGARAADFMGGVNQVHTIAAAHARHGTTSLLATTMTAPSTEIEHALHGIATGFITRKNGGARILGVHLEGPYINADKLGAQPNVAIAATLEQIARFHSIAPIRVLTLAPELAGHLALIPKLVAMGIRVQIGHSNGSYEDGVSALNAGASGFTHLFNAMTGLHHRAPGMVGAALAHAEYAEIIPDLQHVHAGAIRVALRAIPKLFAITDATPACDMPDGEYQLGGATVIQCQGCVRLKSGILAGSSLTMAQALRNLMTIGIDMATCSKILSTHAADYIGEHYRGRLASNSWADIVVLNDSCDIVQVFVEGENIF
jgi:N-acetylglucosamine-6-phosphate deacetylase